MEKTGFSETSVYRYLEIAGLPNEIIELMKEDSERSESVKELLKKTFVTKVEDVLSLDKAFKIATELRGFPKEKMLEVAVDILGLSKDKAFQIIETAKAYPKKSMGEIRDIVYEIRKDGWWESEFRFKPHISEALNTACSDKSMDKKALVMHCVEVWLKEHEYLKEV